MANWLESRQQTYEYYIVDPATWLDKKPITTVKSCSITRDSEVETLGSASFEIAENIGESYVRAYLVTIQNGVKEKHPLGTFLVQTPSISFDGRMRNTSLDAYTPLLELKENSPPIGYYIEKGTNIMDIAYRIARENMRAPVVSTKCDAVLNYDFVADTNDTWLSFLSDLIAVADYSFDLDEMGRVLFAPRQPLKSLRPVFTYNDDNSSILYPELSVDNDIYGIPNVVEVIYYDGVRHYESRVSNDDENSLISTVSRGREIVYRDTDPSIPGIPDQQQIDEYAERLLSDLSSIEYRVSYSHGYCSVRNKDCVRLNYTRAGLSDIKAQVISQTIKCTPGCPVSEKAVFTNNLWR